MLKSDEATGQVGARNANDVSGMASFTIRAHADQFASLRYNENAQVMNFVL